MGATYAVNATLFMAMVMLRTKAASRQQWQRDRWKCELLPRCMVPLQRTYEVPSTIIILKYYHTYQDEASPYLLPLFCVIHHYLPLLSSGD